MCVVVWKKDPRISCIFWSSSVRKKRWIDRLSRCGLRDKSVTTYRLTTASYRTGIVACTVSRPTCPCCISWQRKHLRYFVETIKGCIKAKGTHCSSSDANDQNCLTFLLIILSNSALFLITTFLWCSLRQQRHWKKIFNGLGEHYHPSWQFTVAELQNFDLPTHAQLIKKVTITSKQSSVFLGAGISSHLLAIFKVRHALFFTTTKLINFQVTKSILLDLPFDLYSPP